MSKLSISTTQPTINLDHMTSRKVIGHSYRLVEGESTLNQLQERIQGDGYSTDLIAFNVDCLHVTQVTSYSLSTEVTKKSASPLVQHVEEVEEVIGRLSVQILPGTQLKIHRSKEVYWIDDATFGGRKSPVQIHFDGRVVDRSYRSSAIPSRKSGSSGVSKNDS